MSSSNNRSGKRKTTPGAGSSRSAMKQPLPLNDGRYRRSWKLPSTEEEWRNFQRTNADDPITEEERDDLDDAIYDYMNIPPYDPPTMYYSAQRENADPRPTQVMPAKLKAAITEANEEITALGEKWKENRAIQFEKEANIMEKKLYLASLQQEILREEKEIREIMEEYDVLEDKINKKADWIIECQNIYPY